MHLESRLDYSLTGFLFMIQSFELTLVHGHFRLALLTLNEIQNQTRRHR